VIKKKKGVMASIFALAATIAIIRVIHKLFQKFFLVNKYKNWLGKRLRESDKLRKLKERED
jgi:hypothetical protein